MISSKSKHKNKISEPQEIDEELEEEEQRVVDASSSSGIRMSLSHASTDQVENTSKLVLSVFQKVAHPMEGATAADVTEYLRKKYGELWQISSLTGKAEEILQRSAVLGILEKRGDRYITSLARESCCLRKRKPCCCRKRRRRSSFCGRRRRPICRRRRRRRCRRRKRCGC